MFEFVLGLAAGECAGDGPEDVGGFGPGCYGVGFEIYAVVREVYDCVGLKGGEFGGTVVFGVVGFGVGVPG